MGLFDASEAHPHYELFKRMWRIRGKEEEFLSSLTPEEYEVMMTWARNKLKETEEKDESL